MRKSILSLGLSLVIVLAQAQDSVFYYTISGEKIYLERDNTVKFIEFSNETATRNNRMLNELRSQNVKTDALTPSMYRISGDFNQKSTRNVLVSERDTNILYISDRLVYNGHTVWESNEIIVKVFSSADLEQTLKANRIPYTKYERLGSNPQNYLVTLDVSGRGAIEWANELVENKAVVVAQPSFCNAIRPTNVYYPNQWGLKNTGQYGGISGMDINVEQIN